MKADREEEMAMTASSKRTSPLRKLSIYGFQAVEGGHNTYALLEFDVSGLRKALREARREGRGGSLLAFFVKAIALCLEAYPDFNSMVNLRRTTSFEEVDVSVPIEISRGGEIFNRQLVIRDADRKGVREIDLEIEAARSADDGSMSYLPSPALRRLVAFLPAAAVRAIFRAVLRDHRKVKSASGTVFVTSVSMFSTAPGYVLPYIGGPKASSFAIGSVVRKPVVVRDAIEVREIVNVTAAFNHDLIDGAPAARFVNELKRLVEAGYRESLG
jgi:pyruvate/2-oxoglutarate dehydrogenase complex dihydrolipoamide acyltransferase (E2) component